MRLILSEDDLTPEEHEAWQEMMDSPPEQEMAEIEADPWEPIREKIQNREFDEAAELAQALGEDIDDIAHNVAQHYIWQEDYEAAVEITSYYSIDMFTLDWPT